MIRTAKIGIVLCVAISCVVLPACVRAAQAADSSARSAADRRSPGDRSDGTRESARQILKDSGLTGGVIVHLGTKIIDRSLRRGHRDLAYSLLDVELN